MQRFMQLLCAPTLPYKHDALEVLTGTTSNDVGLMVYCRNISTEPYAFGYGRLLSMPTCTM